MAADRKKTPGSTDQPARRGSEPTAPPSTQASKPTQDIRTSTQSTAQPTGASSLPEKFGRYRIQRKLGQGGMGSVYLAHDSQLDRSLALKVPHFTEADGPEVLERFYREARSAATLSHPNICPVHDVGTIDGIHYVTMAYVEGKPLSELIRGGKKLPQKAVAAVVRKLALAMQEAHAKGIIHRDLKPSNVMINQRNEPVIMDFGLARRAQEDVRLTKSGSILGTPAYMAPEQVGGDPKAIGPGCDIYSLGVILYEMLTGQLPFSGPITAVLGQILTQEPPRPSTLRSDLDPTLEGICLKAMAKKLPARYGSMRDLAAALTAYLKGEASARAAAAPAKAQPVAELVPVGEAAPATSEGLATHMLAKLANRLEADAETIRESQRLAAQQHRTSRWPAFLAALVVLGAIAAIAYVAVANKPAGPAAPPVVNVKTDVVVHLALPKEASDPTVVVILVDGTPRSKEELAAPMSLATGEHVLEIKRKDGKVIKSTFTVGQDDDQKTVKVTPTQPVTPGQREERPVEVVGEPSAELKALIVKLTDPDVKVRLQVANTLRQRGDKSAVPALVKRVADDLWGNGDGWDDRYSSKLAALDALKELGPGRVTEALLLAARSRTVEIRVWACEGLASQKDAESATGLVAALKDTQVPVRVAAAKALAEVRPPATAALVSVLTDLDNRVRMTAGWSLWKLGDRTKVAAEVVDQVAAGAAPALAKRVADDVWSEGDGWDDRYSSKLAALEALKRLAAPARVTEALLDAAHSRTVAVRVWACEGLVLQKDAESTTGLVAALKDAEVPVRVAAARVLADVRPPAVPALVSVLTDRDNKVRMTAGWSLWKLGDRTKVAAELVEQVAEGAVPALAKRVADDVWSEGDGWDDRYSSKLAALEALKRLAPPPRVTEALLAAGRSPTVAVRVWACEGLVQQKDKESAAGLVAALKDAEVPVRVAAAKALAEVRPPETAALVSVLTDRDNKVRMTAGWSLWQLGDRAKVAPDIVDQVAEGAVPALVKRVADDLWASGDGWDDRYSSKLAALEALKRLAPQRVTEALLAAVRSKEESVRVWACEGLAQQKDKESGAGLTDALNDASEKVRTAATEALKKRK
jgi:serine/threonine protein kinase